MPITLNAIRRTIESRIATHFVDYPVYFGNQQTTPPNNASWLWCAINFGDTSYESLDGLDFITGVAQGNIFVPVASGAGVALTIGDRLKALFNRTKISGIYFRPANGPRSVAQSATSPWYQVAVSIQFVADALGGDLVPVNAETEPDNFVYAFSWGDATPVQIFTLAANQVLMSVTVSIQSAFDTDSQISVGTIGDPALFLKPEQSLPTMADDFNSYPFYSSPGSTPIYLTINPGSGNSAGSGFIILSISD